MNNSRALIVVLVIVILAVGGYFLVRNFQTAEPVNNIATQDNSTVSNNSPQSTNQSSTSSSSDSATSTLKSNTQVDTSANVKVNDKNGQADVSTSVAKTVTVNITDSGFSPQTVSIKKGDSVKWVNTGSSAAWPASAVHPTHGSYPTTGGCLGSTFDACKGLASGESWIFQFDFAGNWSYHDHLNSSHFGKVVVTE